MKNFEVIVTMYRRAETAEQALEMATKSLLMDAYEVNERQGGVSLPCLTSRAADILQDVQCVFGKRPGDVRCTRKAIYKVGRHPYCMEHGYFIAGKRPERLYKEEA